MTVKVKSLYKFCDFNPLKATQICLLVLLALSIRALSYGDKSDAET